MASFKITANIFLSDVDAVTANLISNGLYVMLLKEIGLKEYTVTVDEVVDEVHEIVE